ncbi:division/cell wall cluster transcriptional repressor MraZ [Negadavirga shengliensis]|uniref:Transcriptional regulator MraZ n=1 Tax=Negadavirga shengliensis TaxID=1389218 RepID=A0ABV9T1Y8_9BACT
MAFFTGEYECKLDAKGRLVLPAKMKASLPESLGHELMLRRGLEPCLELLTMLEVKKDYSRLASLDDTQDEVRNFRRSYFRREAPVELDNAGRLLIPRTMMRHAQLEKEAIVVGIGVKIEIWNPDLYEEFIIKEEKIFNELNKKYLKKGG